MTVYNKHIELPRCCGFSTRKPTIPSPNFLSMCLSFLHSCPRQVHPIFSSLYLIIPSSPPCISLVLPSIVISDNSSISTVCESCPTFYCFCSACSWGPKQDFCLFWAVCFSLPWESCVKRCVEVPGEEPPSRVSLLAIATWISCAFSLIITLTNSWHMAVLTHVWC